MTRLMMAASAAALLAGAAQAEDRGMEFRFGVTAHDLADHVEDGPNLTAEILFGSPDFLSAIWSPRPYVYGSFNTNGLTNFGSAGLAWNIPLTERLNFEIKEGLSYNDGVVDIDQNAPASDPNRIRLATTRALMGSHILFHTTLGLDYDINERWAVGAYYEHISHGQILASGRNQALDNAGVRLSYRFGR
ncbi:acyloxyacyl hydrolase [Maricaulis sp.]|uniref:acyloxyacyl hydrolase n=1 Tax=Maricaulis sp. TaxID=1486257 RepID=UPI003A8F37D7